MPRSATLPRSSTARPEHLLGSTLPRIYTPPLVKGRRGPCGCGCALTPRTSLGFSAVQFAADVLGIELIPWQRWLLIHALELLPDGRFRFRTVLVLAARQNGKTLIVEVKNLWKLFVLRVPLVIGTAQILDYAEESWDKAVEMVESIPELNAELVHVDRTNGKKAFRLTGGMRWKIAAASRKGGRSLSADDVNLDELREHHTWESWGAVTKDLPNSTPILRADGNWTTIGHLVPGDRIFAPSGKPTTVLEVHPVADLRPMYEVTTTDGRRLTASESHLWTVRDTRQSWDPARAWKTLTTGEIIAEGLRYKRAGVIRWRMPAQQPLLDLPERDLPIDPYVLGCWLGDGTAADGTITAGAEDLEAVAEQLTRAGALVTSRVETRPGTWRVRLHVAGRPLRVVLRETGLLGNKHVPAPYLTASSEQRMALLGGLLDTDGSVTPGGGVSFTAKGNNLALAVQFLARSLGWNARLSSTISTLYGKVCARVWRVTFSLRAGDPIPFRLPRKATRFTSRPRSLPGTGIISIESAATEPSTCIAVDSDDQLFLAGADLVPTHNTTMARRKAQVWAFSNAGDDRSVVLNDLQDKGLAAIENPSADSSLGLFEWSAPQDCPIDDPQYWAMANPSLGYPQGIGVEALRAALGTDPEPIFRTECLCQRVPDLIPSKIPLTAWVNCADSTSKMVGGLVAAWEVSWHRDKAAICIAGFRSDGLPQVEMAEYRDGTDWLPARFGEIAGRQPIAAVVFDPGGPAGSMLTEVTEKLPGRLEPKPMTMRDAAHACGRIYDAAIARQMRQLGDDRLLEMLRKSATRSLADAWAWDRKHSAGDICGLVGVTNALHGLMLYGQPPQPPAKPLVDLSERPMTLDVAKAGF